MSRVLYFSRSFTTVAAEEAPAPLPLGPVGGVTVGGERGGGVTVGGVGGKGGTLPPPRLGLAGPRVAGPLE